MYILVTGALGFIGSHICAELLQQGFKIIAIDNLTNSKLETLEKIRFYGSNIQFFKHDVQNLESVFRVFDIQLVIHLAGSKSVNESIKDPLEYYTNNVCNTVALLETMRLFDCKNLIFSSSATVYGNASGTLPLDENSKSTDLSVITNPYGKTKCMIEEILKDLSMSDSKWNIYILRYFNPIGHLGRLKESPQNQPNNLFPILTEKFLKNETLQIFGNDYETKDGTCIRDFVHVIDVANAHVCCIPAMLKENTGIKIYNVGTGKGTTVLELIEMFEKVQGKMILKEFSKRRDGDVGVLFANVDKIKEELKWKPIMTLEDMCQL